MPSLQCSTIVHTHTTTCNHSTTRASTLAECPTCRCCAIENCAQSITRSCAHNDMQTCACSMYDMHPFSVCLHGPVQTSRACQAAPSGPRNRTCNCTRAHYDLQPLAKFHLHARTIKCMACTQRCARVIVMRALRRAKRICSPSTSLSCYTRPVQT